VPDVRGLRRATESRSVNVLALCAGGGGLDLGLRLAVPEARAVAYVEREAFAAAHLAAAMEAGALDVAPIWADLRTFDARPWRDVVDCITAGYPCTPFSVAGRVKSREDERHLWPHVQRCIRECQPAVVLLENVPNHLRHGFADVASGLQALGYAVASTLWTAAEVGAPHKRERLFILAAHPQRIGLRKLEQWGQAGRDHVQARGKAELALDGTPGAMAGRDASWWSTERGLGRVASGLANRVDRLRMLGNGVVPLQACRAFQELCRSVEMVPAQSTKGR